MDNFSFSDWSNSMLEFCSKDQVISTTIVIAHPIGPLTLKAIFAIAKNASSLKASNMIKIRSSRPEIEI